MFEDWQCLIFWDCPFQVIGGTKRHGAQDHLGDFQARLAEPSQAVSKHLQAPRYQLNQLIYTYRLYSIVLGCWFWIHRADMHGKSWVKIKMRMLPCPHLKF